MHVDVNPVEWLCGKYTAHRESEIRQEEAQTSFVEISHLV